MTTRQTVRYLCENPSCPCAQPERGYPKWRGQCSECGSLISPQPWIAPPGWKPGGSGSRSARSSGNWHGDGGETLALADVPPRGVARLSLGMTAVDRVLGGGLPEGATIILSGPPGIGKSTLTLQMASAVAQAGHPVFLVTGEENRSAVRERWDRLGLAGAERIFISAETDVVRVEQEVEARKPRLVIIDSLRTLWMPDVASARGSYVQQRECTEVLLRLASRTGATVLVTQHVNKDDEMAGLRELAHMYDTVLRFESASHHVRRLLAEKNRFGATHEIALLTMEERGLRPIDDVSAWALAERVPGVFGSVVVPVLDGSRVHLVEMQALTQSTRQVPPTRRFVGIDRGTAETLLAVLAIHGGIAIAEQNVFFKVARDMRAEEAAAQLGFLVAAASAAVQRPVPTDVALIGEVDMGGVIRSVPAVDRRAAEAARYGCRRIFVPAFGTEGLTVPGAALIRVQHIREVLDALQLRPGRPGRQIRSRTQTGQDEAQG